MPRQILKAALLSALIVTSAVAQDSSGQTGTRNAPAVRLAQLYDLANLDGGYLGVVLTPLNAEMAKSMKLDAGTKGARVERVLPGGPAEKAGIKADDVIVSVDEALVAGEASVREWLSDRKPGDRVKLGVLRDGKRQTVEVVLGERPGMKDLGWLKDNDGVMTMDGRFPENFEIEMPALMHLGVGGPRLGVAVMPLTDQLREHFGVEKGKGVLVSSVSKDSAAERAGIRAGDVIVTVDGEAIDGAGDIGRILRKGDDAQKTVSVEVVRDRQRQTFSATVESPRPANEE